MRRKDKKNHSGKLMAIFIAVIMTGSIAGFVILDSDKPADLEYNGYDFKQTKNGFSTEIEEINLDFHFHPLDVVEIPFTMQDIDMLKNGELILITSDENNTLQRGISLLEFEIENRMRLFDIQAVHGFTSNNTNSLPVITCDDGNINNPVIYLRQSNTTTIETNDYCIEITAKNEYDVIRIKDAIMYRLLGII